MTDAEMMGDVRNVMAGRTAGPRHRCPGPGCLTLTTRPLCQFCTRTVELEAVMPTKTCLRCRLVLSLDSFAGNGRYRLCDECRWSYPMTDEEKRLSKDLAPSYDLRRRRTKYRQQRLAA